MDLHIERPELTAETPEQNIAAIDTWIADTSDKLNIALTSMRSTSSSASTASSPQSVNIVNRVPYLGDYQVEATQVIYTQGG